MADKKGQLAALRAFHQALSFAITAGPLKFHGLKPTPHKPLLAEGKDIRATLEIVATRAWTIGEKLGDSQKALLQTGVPVPDAWLTIKAIEQAGMIRRGDVYDVGLSVDKVAIERVRSEVVAAILRMENAPAADTLTKKEAAQLIGISPRSANLAISKGTMAARNDGTIDRAEAERYKSQNHQPAKRRRREDSTAAIEARKKAERQKKIQKRYD